LYSIIYWLGSPTVCPEKARAQQGHIKFANKSKLARPPTIVVSSPRNFGSRSLKAASTRTAFVHPNLN
jgi:hypothetical protein